MHNKKKLGAIQATYQGYHIRQAPKGQPGVCIYAGKKVKGSFPTVELALRNLKSALNYKATERETNILKDEDFFLLTARVELNDLSNVKVLTSLRERGYRGNRKEMKEQIKVRRKAIDNSLYPETLGR